MSENITNVLYVLFFNFNLKIETLVNRYKKMKKFLIIFLYLHRFCYSIL